MKKRQVLTALAAILALGTAAKASANEPDYVSSAVDTVYVTADSLSSQTAINPGRDSPSGIQGMAGEYLVQTTAPQVNTGGHRPKQVTLSFGFNNSELGVEGIFLEELALRLRPHTWMTASISGNKVPEEYGHYHGSSKVIKTGLEVRSNPLNIEGLPPVEAIVGGGLDLTNSPVRDLDKGFGTYGYAGFGISLDDFLEDPTIPSWFPTGFKTVYGNSSSRGRECSSTIQFTISRKR